MIIQFYNLNKTIRVFNDGNSKTIFEIQSVDYHKLDALGLPRLKKKNCPWKKVSWGWEIQGEFSFLLDKHGNS